MTFFVGQSAPVSGDFFYYGNNAMLTHMQRAVEQALGGGGDFLDRFKAYGWYLDDLVLTPVNQLKGAERGAKCRGAQSQPCGSYCGISAVSDRVTYDWHQKRLSKPRYCSG